MGAKTYPPVSAEYAAAIAKARRELRALIAAPPATWTPTPPPHLAPPLCGSWHNCGTYDVKTNTGGPNGTIRNNHELSHQANAGLTWAVQQLECIHDKLPVLSYADIYQLAGVVAVEVTGGPDIDFVPGRLRTPCTNARTADEAQSVPVSDKIHTRTLDLLLQDLTDSPDEGRLPNPTKGADHLRQVFVTQMGMSDKDIVVLSGAHTLGRCHKERSGFEGPWTEKPLKFSNDYFQELMGGERDGLLQLPSDKVLVEDDKFRLYVELYAKDEDAFFADYAESHKKLSELGFGKEN
eukprot:SM000026S08838  [mRNA]  locus=s26:60345:62237:+ [translate_table: standard]